ncbi:hypothetical protein KVT40_000765 [Elsinoe batatas]|uniref:Arrestin C-terminal-like domain-containing protein n=1 Tax=Elsinoe batatas TaxID=2601811 RepID=A0A8K0LA82_9PEZI|nr:hypothetical protein KVT40_000765 [Elsinoe batatas]
MANRYHLRPNVHRPPTDSQQGWSQPTTPIKDSSSILRPLSDIREITEPSIAEVAALRATQDKSAAVSGAPRQTSFKQSGSSKRTNSVKIVEPQPSSSKSKGKQKVELAPHFSSTSEEGLEGSDTYSLPIGSIPPRHSSQNLKGISLGNSITVDGHAFPEVPRRIPDRGRSNSPVRQIRDRLDPVKSDTSRRIPSGTFIRDPCPFDIVDQPISRHNRIAAQLQVVAPLFVGGGSVEGFARIAVNGVDWSRQRRALLISRISVDLLGIEELVGQHRRSVFLSLATELLNAEHPPPNDMVESTTPLSFRDCLWILKPSISHLPFRISLPLDVGPAPFRSKTAQIRYLLSMSIYASENGSPVIIRQSQEISVLSTYDPERALRSLPSPLTAFDEIHLARHGQVETVRLTAGLHRQVWVSGSSIFVDIHVANNSHKTLKKLELSVERDILYYRHAAASTLEKSASQARIFQDKEQTVLRKTSLKVGKYGWNGVSPHGSVVRTCDIELPRGHTTVRCGKFFEVRYFLNITIGSTHMRFLSVQLPIILIHMNSLDVVPNAVSQVAAAIEEKRAAHQQTQSRKTSGQSSSGGKLGQHSRDHSSASSAPSRARTTDPSRMQGKAFAAPRQQSLEQRRAHASELQGIGQALDRSPRRYKRHNKSSNASPAKTGQGAQSRRLQGTASNHDDRYAQQHKFALHNAPSNNSLGGLSVGSYTVLNGSNMNVHMDGQDFELAIGQSATDTMRRKLRGIKSLDSFRRARTEIYHSGPQYHDLAQDVPHNTSQAPTSRRQHVVDQIGLQLPPSALGMSNPRSTRSA